MRSHVADFDVRAIMKELEMDATSSAQGRINLRASLQAIISMRCTSDWKKSYLEFITTIEKMIMNYNAQQHHSHTKINEDMIRQYIEAAVAPCRPLREVSTREMEKIADGSSTGYNLQTYVWLLKTAATHADEGRGLRKTNLGAFVADIDRDNGRGPPQRNINAHQVLEDPEEDEEVREDIVEMLAFQAQARRARPGARMNRATWDKLTPEGRKVWDTLTDADKIHLLRYSAGRGDGDKKDSNPTRKVNFTDLEVEEAEDDEQPNITLDVNNSEVEGVKEAHPADPRRMMSTPTTKGPKNGAKREVNTTRMNFAGLGSEEDVDDAVEGYWNDSSDEEDFW